MKCLLYLSSDVGRRSILLSGHVSFIFCQEKLADDSISLAEFVQCITDLMSTLISQKDTSHIPQSMVATAFLLQGMFVILF